MIEEMIDFDKVELYRAPYLNTSEYTYFDNTHKVYIRPNKSGTIMKCMDANDLIQLGFEKVECEASLAKKVYSLIRKVLEQ